METTDKELVKAYISGENEAFEELVRRHGRVLLGYLTRMCNDQKQAEDIFQETFKKVHEKAHTFKGENFRGWIYTIATRTVYSDARKRKFKFVSLNRRNDDNPDGTELTEVLMTDDSDNPHDRAERAELKQQVRDALGRLPGRQRAAVVLSYYEQMPHKQIAETLGCSTGSVKTHIFRALKTLSKHLPEGGVYPSG